MRRLISAGFSECRDRGDNNTWLTFLASRFKGLPLVNSRTISALARV
jgi:hypothetical protein